MSTVTFLDVTATAKLVRAALKEAFPGITFSVRCDRYSMGASIDVRWEDGPTEVQVVTVTDPYRRSDFDGSDDSTSYRPATMTADGPVRFGADFITTSRRLSAGLKALLIDDVEHWLGECYEPRKEYAVRVTSTGMVVHDWNASITAGLMVHALAETTEVTADREIRRTQ